MVFLSILLSSVYIYIYCCMQIIYFLVIHLKIYKIFENFRGILLKMEINGEHK